MDDPDRHSHWPQVWRNSDLSTGEILYFVLRRTRMRHAALIPIALACLTVACSDAPATAEYPDAVTADPDHYSVEFENDVARLLRIRYGAGETSTMHHHPANCAIFLGVGMTTFELPDGEVIEAPATELGEVMCTDAEDHLPTNVGDEPFELVLIEFKDGGAAGSATAEYPDAVTADPDHYSVEFENDVARLLRIRYGAGETSTMHHHPANCAIFLGVGMTTFELPDGEVIEAPATELGEVMCGDADVHLPTNVGDEPFELVLLELKGRAAFQE
jgi:oxalate decarboxylase/phosphoglucose isomerase-like protein (cupin superfamily)